MDRWASDVLVNAAGIYRFGPALELSPEAGSEMLEVNLRGSFLVARTAVARLREAGPGGAVVNVSSVAALIADRVEPAAHCNASKAGVVALTKQLAVDGGDRRLPSGRGRADPLHRPAVLAGA